MAIYLAPGLGIEPRLTESKSVVLPLHNPGINICVKTYEQLTPQGLYFHLCLYKGVCCVMVQDVYDNTYFEMQYFTNVNKALRFINNL